jgi:toxin ParE1/3/4
MKRYGILLTDEARKDIDDIADYIALDAPRRAETYVDKLFHEIHSLASMPKRCAVAPESGRRGYEMRHLIYGRYRILFTIKDADIYILRVIHGARLLDPEG